LASASVAVNVPTGVPLAEFSGTVITASFATGASLTFDREITTCAVSLSGGAPLSVACTVRLNTGVVSKSSTLPSATVMAPVVGSMAKPPAALPAVIA
jgi:hypothetical protein